jgi:hypothetical protein
MIGIVLRSGLAQDLPFAPIVWKRLAGETSGAGDVLEIDDDLRSLLKSLKGEARSERNCQSAGHGTEIALSVGSFDTDRVSR